MKRIVLLLSVGALMWPTSALGAHTVEPGATTRIACFVAPKNVTATTEAGASISLKHYEPGYNIYTSYYGRLPYWRLQVEGSGLEEGPVAGIKTLLLNHGRRPVVVHLGRCEPVPPVRW